MVVILTPVVLMVVGIPGYYIYCALKVTKARGCVVVGFGTVTGLPVVPWLHSWKQKSTVAPYSIWLHFLLGCGWHFPNRQEEKSNLKIRGDLWRIHEVQKSGGGRSFQWWGPEELSKISPVNDDFQAFPFKVGVGLTSSQDSIDILSRESIGNTSPQKLT